MAAGLSATVVVVLATSCNPTVPGTSCESFPPNSFWHTPISKQPTLSNSAAMVDFVGATKALHADFGSGLWDGGPIGIPFVAVPGTQPGLPVTFEYADESDQVGYPIPANPPIEGGAQSTGDRHILMVDKDACRLYELYSAYPPAGGSGWTAGSGATWDLKSNALRPAGWTSADAAGLAILPGLVTYDEVAAGTVTHPIRMTVPVSRTAYVWPARHEAGSTTNVNAPRMGERFRLRSSVDPSTFPAQVRPIIVALQTYGAIVADNGSAWYLSGAPDPRWDNDQLATLSALKGGDFEAVDASSQMVSPDSGEAHPAS
ncbi:MAG: hypothetical protein JST73_11665 [Actinobacteria bacterium]|nr:hypothetical protein [Actinomycetota bacterium]